VKVLVADDDMVSRRLLEAMLTRLGYDVVVAADGLEARAILLAPDGPQLAILDWLMPGADGLEVCRAVRERPTPYVYVILLTSKDQRHDLVTAFDAQVDDFITKPYETLELRARLRSGERVVTLQTRLLETQALLKHQASHDPLTGLWNRGQVHAQLDADLVQARRTGHPMSIIMADIDHFKHVNDRHGHAAGDDTLQIVARRVKDALRTSDQVSRYGGEEFLILLPDTPLPEARLIAERVRQAVASTPVATRAGNLDITLSLGVASSTEAGLSRDSLLAAADEALYRAKAGGRNRVEG
jgi:two-component system cell cycle response regulator